MSVSPVGLVVTAALMAGQMALQMSQRIEGQRLDDLTVTVADYGTALNYFQGIRVLTPPIFWAEPLKEVEEENKTKGGKYSQYKYFATLACAIADHEIAGVSRVWFDEHLVFDLTGNGPISIAQLFTGQTMDEKGQVIGTSRFGVKPGKNMRIYLGTDDQEPDPRMLATIEDEHGPGSCPGYRNVAYLMFEDIPLEKFGNRIPQIKIEAVTAVDNPFSFETIETTYTAPGLKGFAYSPDYSRVIWRSGQNYEIWDLAARKLMVRGEFPEGVSTFQDVLGLSNAGTIYSIIGGGTDGRVGAFSPDGLAFNGAVFDFNEPQNQLQLLRDGLGYEWIFTTPGTLEREFYAYRVDASFAPFAHNPIDELDTDFCVSFFCTDSYGDIWATGAPIGSTDTVYFWRMVENGEGIDTDFFSATVDTNGAAFTQHDHVISHHNGHFLLLWWGKLYKIEEGTGTVVATKSGVGANYQQFANLPPGSETLWSNFTEISLDDLSTIRTEDFTDWTSQDAEGTIFDPINHALISFPQFDDNVTWRYLDRVGSDGVTLGSIVEFVAEMAGITDIDVADLTQTITGYSWTHGSGRSILEPLLDAYDSFLRPHGFGLQGLQRGDSSDGTIDVQHFVRQSDRRYELTIIQDTDLPRSVTFNFADTDADQQTNNAHPQRPLDAVDSVRDMNIDLTTLALDADEARQLGERWFRRKWFSREGLKNGLTAQELASEPGDVKTLTYDGESVTYRLKKTNIGADGVTSCEWERDDPAIAVLPNGAGAAMDGRAPSILPIPALSQGFFLDIPLLRDIDEATNAQVYFGAGPYNPDQLWTGAAMLESVDGGLEYDTQFGAVSPSQALTWGRTTDVLPDALTSVWDHGSSVNVTVMNGTLTSATVEACQANPFLNLAIIGQETLQFATATLELDGSYTLTNFRRGRRGTEWATAGHAIGDSFALADDLLHQSRGASDLGDNLYFKAVTQGRNVQSGFPVTLAPFTGASHKPYSPVHVEAEKDAGSGDWTINWVRRTRIGGAWTGGTDIPLGEATEAYKVDIMDGVDIARTIDVTSPTATYDASMQTTDFGGSVAVGDLDIRVTQVSALVGRGYAAEASF